MRLEPLEQRQLLAIGPQIVQILPNEGPDLLPTGKTLNISPREITFRFNDGEVIDPNTLAGIQITRDGPDNMFGTPDDVFVDPLRAGASGVQRGFVGIGNFPNEVVIRFAETLPDDFYRITLVGDPMANPLRNNKGEAFDNGLMDPMNPNRNVDFTLDRATQVVAVVPQPVDLKTIPGTPNDWLRQDKNQIVVYFDANDPLLDSTGPGGAENPIYYQLIRTNETATTADDQVFSPATVNYTFTPAAGPFPAISKAVLTFASNLDAFGTGTYRLRIGDSDTPPNMANLETPILITPASDAGDTFAGANTQVGNLDATSASQVITAAIDPQPFLIPLPGAENEPGHREIPIQSHIEGLADIVGGIPTIRYNFKPVLGPNPQGGVFLNNITDNQKARAREVFEYLSYYSGVQFVETADQGIVVATGDLRAVNVTIVPPAAPPNNAADGVAVFGQIALIDESENWGISEYGGDYFKVVFKQIGLALGLGQAHDLPPITIGGNLQAPGPGAATQNGPGDPNQVPTGQTPEQVFPGAGDIIHFQHLFRPDSKDIDIYRFQVSSMGLFSAETVAERLTPSASTLDSVITLYEGYASLRVPVTGGATAGLDGKTFTIDGVTFEFDSNNSVTETPALRKVAFTAADSASAVATSMANAVNNAVTAGSLSTSIRGESSVAILKIKGNATVANGVGSPLVQSVGGDIVSRNDDYYSEDSYVQLHLVPGVYYVAVTSTGNTSFDPTIADSGFGGRTQGQYQLRMNFVRDRQTGEFMIDAGGSPSNLNDALDGDGDGRPGGTYNFWFRVATDANQVFVDKTAPAGGDGTLARPYNRIDLALADPKLNNPGINDTDILRIVGNRGGDGMLLTPDSGSPAYEIGFNSVGGGPLSDGTTFDVPKGVTVMIDAGAIFKMRQANINVGSFAQGVDRSQGHVQVLGTPEASVFFTSFHNEAIGQDSLPGTPTVPVRGDFGGIVYRNDLDFAEKDVPMPGSRRLMEEAGIFYNYVANANMTYGGGQVVVNSIAQRYQPLYLAQARPTLTFNTITDSLEAAISADPDSFADTKFQNNFPGTAYTADYDRVGPHIYGNRLTTFDAVGNVVATNSINGLFVRIRQQLGQSLDLLTIPARWDDTDIVHVLTENLIVRGTPGGNTEVVNTTPIAGGNPLTTEVTGNDTIAGAVATNLDPRTTAGFGVYTVTGQIGDNPGLSTFTYRDVDLYRVDLDVGSRLRIDVDFTGTLTPLYPLDSVLRLFNPDGTPVLDVDGRPIRSDDALQRDTFGVAEGSSLDPSLDFTATRAGTYYVGISAFNNFNYNPTIAPTDAGPPDNPILDRNPGGPEPYNIRMQVYRQAARIDGRLAIDPGIVVKIDGARIETQFGSQLIAEGTAGNNVIFTARQDDRYGAGGTFDTNGDLDASLPGPGRWGGIFLGHTSSGSLDHVLITNAGGNTRIEGGFDRFNAVEIHQAEARITNSVLRDNDDGRALTRRGNRGTNTPATIFVRGAQPIIVNNVIRDNLTTIATAPIPVNAAITIDANSLISRRIGDVGRQTGNIDRFGGYDENRGPVVDANRLGNNGINGLLVRGGTVTSESVWDDTGIVHVVQEEIQVMNHHHMGGIRLESSESGSLVVKLQGTSAGFTANGVPLDIDDRIGGTLQVVGTPRFPVVLTSLLDDSVGAGLDPIGLPQLNTNNAGGTPAAGNWRSIRFEKYANDRNSAVVNEIEQPYTAGAEANNAPTVAQFLGELGPNEKSGDDNRRLGFEVHGSIALDSPGDVDVYSFNAPTGSEVWLDIDRTTHSLDTIIELIQFDGTVLARSDNSTAGFPGSDTYDALGYINNVGLPGNIGRAMQRDAFLIPGQDFYTTNPRDAGMRIVDPLTDGLPGGVGQTNTYFVRVRSANPATVGIGTLGAGITKGNYQLRIRLRETDEVPGATVRYADIRFGGGGAGTQGPLEVRGLPAHSPLVGEAALPANFGDDTTGAAVNLGNLLTADRNTLSVGGSILAPNDVDFYRFTVDYDLVQFIRTALPPPNVVNGEDKTWAAIFDIDYADGLTRANTNISVFDAAGNLILLGTDSNLSDDQFDPVAGPNTTDLTRGSFGPRDPYIGSVQLPEGATRTYFVAISSDQQLPTALQAYLTANPTQPQIRLEPINYVKRIAEDHIGFTDSAVHPNGTNGSQPLFGEKSPDGGIINLGLNAKPWTLSDTTLFFQTGTSLLTIDPFTGIQETFVGQTLGNGNGGYRDIMMLNNGTLTSFTAPPLTGANSGNTGNYVIINTGTGAQALVGDDGIDIGRDDGMGTINIMPNMFVTFEAMAYLQNYNSTAGRQLFAVGNIGGAPTAPSVPPATGIDEQQTITIPGAVTGGYFRVGSNETQSLTLTGAPTGGTFTLSGNEIQELIVNNATGGTFNLRSNELQTLNMSGTATSGTFTLSEDEVQTVAINGNPTGGTFRLGLNEWQTIGMTGTPTGGTFTIDANEMQQVTITGNPTGGTFQIGRDEVQRIAAPVGGNYQLLGSETQTVTIAGAPMGGTFTLSRNELQRFSLSGNPTGGTFRLGRDEVQSLTLTGTPIAGNFTLTGNEIQRVQIVGGPTGGDFTLTYNPGVPETTAPIAFNATASDVQMALEALPSINPGDITVTSLPGSIFEITFSGGAFAGTNVVQLTASHSFTGGVSPNVVTSEFMRGFTTGNIAFNATAAQVQTALQTVLGAANVTATGTALPAGPVRITFPSTGAFGSRNVPQIAVGTNLVVGGAPSITTPFQGFQTAPLVFNATNAQIQAELENFLGAGNILVTGGPLPGSPTPNQVNLEYVGALAGTDVPFLTGDGSGLTGGVAPNVNIIVPTPATLFDGFTTAPIAYNATAAAVQTILEMVPAIGAGNVAVSFGTFPMGMLPANPIQITFQGVLAGTDFLQMTANSSGLTGGSSPTATVGTFMNGFTTGNLAAASTAAQVQTALEAFLGVGNVTATGGALPGAPIDVTFTGIFSNTYFNPPQLIPVGGAPNPGITTPFPGFLTLPLNYNATTAQVQAALEAIPSIGAGNVQVTGGALPTNPVTITYVGTLAGTNMPPITTTHMLTGGTAPNVAASTFLDGFVSNPLAFNATAATIQAELNTRLGAGNTIVTAGPLPGTPVRIEFTGIYSQRNMPPLIINSSVVGGTAVNGLLHNGFLTAPLAFNATAAQVQTELEAHLGVGNVIVTGGALPGSPISVQFTNAVGRQEILPMQATNDMFTGGTTPMTVISEHMKGFTTAPVPFNATAAAIQAALNAVIGAGNSLVTGGALPTEVNIEFTGAFGNRDILPIIISNNVVVGGTPVIATLINGFISSSLPFNATAAQVQTELNARFGVGNVMVSGGTIPGMPIMIEYTGLLGKRNISVMTTVNALTSMTGTPDVTVCPFIDGFMTVPLAFNAPAATVQAALLAGLGTGNVTVIGGALPGLPLTISYQGNLAAKNVPPLMVTHALTGGTAPSAMITTPVEGEGTFPIRFNATAQQVDTELERLSFIGPNSVQVTGPVGGVYTITYINDKGSENVPQLIIESSCLVGGVGAVATPRQGSAPDQTINLLYNFNVANGTALRKGGNPLVPSNPTPITPGPPASGQGIVGLVSDAERIKGIAFVGGTMYAVTDAAPTPAMGDQFGGRLYTVTLGGFATPVPGFVPRNGVNFVGLTVGPQTVEGGRYSQTLFALDTNGRLHAFNTDGAPQPIFVDGQTSVQVRDPVLMLPIQGQGIAFSTLDYNMWHVTQQRDVQAGHGINPSFDNSRGGLPIGQATQTPFNNSFYFGMDDPRAPTTVAPLPDAQAFLDHNNPAYGNSPNVSSPTQANGFNPNFFYMGYDMPGGAHGSLITNPFSLEGVATADRPYLYFNYFLSTQDKNFGGNPVPTLDTARVFASTDDGATWKLLATNDFVLDLELPEFLSSSETASADNGLNGRQRVQPLFDNSSTVGWRQARVSMGDFAGQKNMRLRFDFSTAGSMNAGDPLTTGVNLQAIPGKDLRDGQTFQIADINADDQLNPGSGAAITFEFDSGFTLVVQTAGGFAISQGDTFVVSDGTNPAITFVFDKTNTIMDTATLKAIDISNMDSAMDVAMKIQAAVDAAFPSFVPGTPGVTPHLNNNRVNLQGAMNLTVTSTGLTFEGNAPGVPSATRIFVHEGMTPEEVAQRIGIAIDLSFTGTVLEAVPGSQITDGMRFTLRRTQFPGTGGSFNDFTFEFDSNGTPANPFTTQTLIPFTGAETAEQIATLVANFINAATLPPVPVPPAAQSPTLNLTATQLSAPFARYVRLRGPEFRMGTAGNLANTTPLTIAHEFKIEAVSGGQMPNDGQTFTISDGLITRTFEFDRDPDGPLGPMMNDGVAPGNIQIVYDPSQSVNVVANNMIAAINAQGFNFLASVDPNDRYVTITGPHFQFLGQFVPPGPPANRPLVLTYTSSKVDRRNLALFNKVPVQTGTDPVTSGLRAGPLPFDGGLVGDGNGAFGSNLRGQNNRFEGWYIDDVMIGLAERGEMVTGATPNTTFTTVNVDPTPDFTQVLVGSYQLEIRRGHEYAAIPATNSPGIDQFLEIHSNDRDVQDWTIIAREGSKIYEDLTITIEDGTNRVNFVFDSNNSVVENATTRRLIYNVNDTAAAVALTIQNAINAAKTAGLLNVTSTRIAPTSERVDLFGAARVFTATELPTTVVDQVSLLENVTTNPLDPAYNSNDIIARAVNTGLSSRNPGKWTGLGIIGDYPTTLNNPASDVDFVRFDLNAGDRVRIDVDAFGIEDSSIGTLLRLFFGPPGAEIPVAVSANNPAPGEDYLGELDEHRAWINPDSYIDFIARATGTYYLGISGAFWGQIGPYGEPAPFASIPNSAYLPNIEASQLLPPPSGWQPGRSFKYNVTVNVNGRLDMFDSKADRNIHRDQGMILIEQNRVSQSTGFGIVVDASTRDNALPHPGGAHNLQQLNPDRLAPSVLIENNLIFLNSAGGILFSGDPNAAGQSQSIVPFGRILNNTIYGGDTATGIGINVTENAAPTVLNNIVANLTTGVIIDGTSRTDPVSGNQRTVLGGMLYQNAPTTFANTGATNGGLGDFPISLAAGAPLFVSAATRNFYLAAGALAIDASVESLPDRLNIVNVTNSAGIPQSPVVAPRLDLFGNLRVDDPTMPPFGGLGSNVFIDRGAIERVNTITIADVSMNEGNVGFTDFVFTLLLTRTDSNPVVVSFITADGPIPINATFGADYVNTSGTITFNPGQTQKTLTVQVIGDVINEVNETFLVNLFGESGAVLADNQAVGTIINDDPLPILSINDITQTEGDVGTTDFVFTVSLNTISGQQVTVNFATANGTATQPADYLTTNGTVTFAPGTLTQNVTVRVVGDTVIEPNETFFVNLTAPTNALITGPGSDPQGQATIQDDDSKISISDGTPLSVMEGNTGVTNVLFTVTLSAVSPFPVSVDFMSMGITATTGVDIGSVSGALTFAPGETTKTITVPVIGDLNDEPDETFKVALSNAMNGIVVPGGGNATIIDDDGPPPLAISNRSLAEGDSGTTDFVFNVTVNPVSGFAITVAFATADVTATDADNDYEPTSGTLTFAPGQGLQQITVVVNGDPKFEGNETFNVVLSSAVNATLPAGPGIGTIVDDEPRVSINPVNVTVMEGNSGTVNAVFNATLSKASSQEITVEYQTADFTATDADNDYEPTSGTLTFAAGSTTANLPITVVVNGDINPEPNESFRVNLLNPNMFATLGTQPGVGVIVDDEPRIFINDVTVTEGHMGTVDAVFSVTLDAPSTFQITVDYATSPGPVPSAVSPDDFIATSGMLTFAPGSTTTTPVTVQVVGELLQEFNELFQVNLSNSVAAQIADGIGLGTILDDDAPPPISISNVSLTEGNSGTKNFVFDVTLPGMGSGRPITVDFATSNGTATTFNNDYVAASGSLSFAPGEVSKTITVLVNGDAIFEGNETFNVNLSNAVNAVLPGGPGIGTIVDDEPRVSINSVSVNELDSMTVNAVFSVTLDVASTQQVTVQYATTNGTAIAPADYSATSGALTFAAGQTTTTPVTVVVQGDTLDEDNETFNVVLSNVSNTATILTGTGVGTIVDDSVDDVDPLPDIVVSNVSMAEGDSGASNMVFTVVLSPVSGRTVSVAFATADGTATLANNDYVATSGTLTFAAGTTQRTITVPIVGNIVREPDEQFFINFSSPTNAMLPVSQAVGTILDDEPFISIADVTVGETDSGTSNAVFVITLSHASGGAIAVELSTQDGTAISTPPAQADFVAQTNTTVSFVAGQTLAAVTVQIVGDLVDEDDETFNVVLTSSTIGGPFADGVAVGTILDNDALPMLSISDAGTIAEGNFGTANAVFMVTLSPSSGRQVTAVVNTSDGTASAGSDYTALGNTTLTFSIGQTSKLVTVPVLGDIVGESNETFFLNLVSMTNALAGDPQGVGTIADDEPRFNIADTSVTETGGTVSAVFTITLTGSASGGTTLAYSTLNGTAIAGLDYTGVTSGTVSFAAGQTSRTITVDVLGDSLDEDNETFFVNVSAAAGVTNVFPGDSQAVGTIVDEDPLPQVAIGNVTVNEGDSGQTAARFPVTLSAVSGRTVTVTFTTAPGGTATVNTDFLPTNGTLTFNPGETSKQITVLVNGDVALEADETFIVNLTGATSAALTGPLADAQAIGTIFEDEPRISVADASVVEGDTSSVNMVFTVNLNRASTTDIVFSFSTSNINALAGSDYTATSGTLTFSSALAETVKQITVNVLPDTIDEVDESFQLTLSSSPNRILDGVAIGTIIDNEGTPSLSFSDISVLEGDSGATIGIFNLFLSAPTALAVSVEFATGGGTATAGTDYAATSGTINFAAGQTSRALTVQVNGDLAVEGNETFQLTLSNLTNATFAGPSTRTATIIDDEPVISIANLTITEGDTAVTNALFAVTLSKPAGQAITVAYASAAVTATPGIDYFDVSGTLTFMAGESSKIISVPIVGDTIDEINESFQITLSAQTNATLGASVATGTIIDDDAGPSISVDDVTVDPEGDTGTTTDAVFTVSLSSPSSFQVTVAFGTSPVTADANSDYTPTSGTFTFLPGETTKTVTVQVLGDLVVEQDETYTLSLSAPVNATLAKQLGIGTIVDDEPRLSIDDAAAVDEASGNVLVYNVRLSKPSPALITVVYATANGTATAPADYTAQSGTLTFTAGTTVQPVSIAVQGDVLDEDDETVLVNLSNPTNTVIVDGQGEGTILDNDPLPSLSINSVTVNETDAGANAVFTVTLSTVSGRAVTVVATTASGTATVPADVAALAANVTFAAGQTVQQVTVPIVGDNVEEPNETFTLNLGGAVNATISQGTGTGTIVDDDPLATINDVTVTETDGPGVTAVFTVTLSKPAIDPISIAFSTTAGTATAGVDYLSAGGNLSFVPGQTQATLTVQILGDSLDEASETFTVTLTPVNGSATAGDFSGLGVIVDNDPPPTAAINDISLFEGNSGTTNAVFTVTLGSVSGQAVTLTYTTLDGFAVAPSDYNATSGTITFAAGTTTQRITVQVNGDTIPEAPETFNVFLTGGTNVHVIDNQGVALILNDEARNYIVNGADFGGGPHVQVFDEVTLQQRFSFFAYAGAFTGGVRVASGDVTGDGQPDIITAPGRGGGPHIRIFDGNTGASVGNLFAFESSFTGGLNIAVGDVNGDGRADIMVGTDGQPGESTARARVFDGASLNLLREITFTTPGDLSTGVRVAAGDYNGDGRADLFIGASRGSVPRVQVYDVASGGLFANFLAYAPAFTGGFYIAAGDLNSDGRADIITGAGAGGGPHVLAFNAVDLSPLANFFAFNGAFTGGVRVGVTDFNRDGVPDIIAGAGPGGGPHVRVLSGVGLLELASYFAYSPAYTGGVNVGGSYRGAGSPLQAYGGGTSASEPQPALTLDEIRPLINQAIANWEAAGLDAQRVQKLRDMEVRIADLSGPYLGMAYASTIYIDSDAAGYGWFIDQTPDDSSEFGSDGRATEGPAAGRMDLLTALTHELGHALGLDDLDGDEHGDDIMGDLLPLGVRRAPMLEAVDALFANDGWE